MCENEHICFPSSANWVIINSGQEHNCLKQLNHFFEMKKDYIIYKTVLSAPLFLVTKCVSSHICNVVQYAKSYIVCL